MLNNKALLFVFCIIFLCVCPFCTQSQEAPQTNTLIASVEVEGFVQLELAPDSLSLGRMQPGSSTTPTPVGIICTTNVNTPWVLTLHSRSPFVSSENFEIPLSNFNWQVESSDEEGTPVLSGTLSMDPVTIYVAPETEYVTEAPVELTLLFTVDIPAGQARGTYEGFIIVTMQPAVM